MRLWFTVKTHIGNIENNETADDEYPNENITESINSLHSKQREAFHTWYSIASIWMWFVRGLKIMSNLVGLM